MAIARQVRKSIFDLLVSAAIAALAVAIAGTLTIAAPRAAQAQTFNVIHNFTCGNDGGNPFAGLTMDRAGNLYGTAIDFHCLPNYGTVYQLKHHGSGWTVNPLYRFTGGSDGAVPFARVIFGPDGTLYGTTNEGGPGGCTGDLGGCGTVFHLRPQPRACTTALCPWTETVLYSFEGGSDGAGPAHGDLIFDQAGNIYGTADTGGTGNCNGETCGVVYELKPSGSGWTESVLYSFSGSDGAIPYNDVIFDNAGNLYGITYAGGVSGYGTVFELTPEGGGQWTESCLYSFSNGSDGSYPIAGLIFDQSRSNLYGATSDGGTRGGGTVFEVTLGANCSWTVQTLYSFTGTAGDRCGPRGSLVMDGAGNLYGTTFCDGAHAAGSVFELTPSGNSWTYTSLHDFTGGNDGENPISTVVFDANGNVYGTALNGGPQHVGVVWEITP